MTKREELLSLADRVEALTGPDREVDADIAVAISNDPAAWVVRDIPSAIFTHKPGWWRDRDDKSHSAPSYTASLDAAMTLVPDGWRIYTADFSIKNRARWMMEGPKLERIEQEDGTWEAGEDWYKSGTGNTAALGLIVACLRALASQEPNA